MIHRTKSGGVMNEIEKRGLDFILQGDSPVFQTLGEQVKLIQNVDRKWSSKGLEAVFGLSDSVVPLEDKQMFELSDVYAEFEGISPDPGLVLWVNEGKIFRFVCFSFDQDFNESSKLLDLYYVELSDSQIDFDVRRVDARNEERTLWPHYLRCKHEFRRTEMSQ
jgi:hypothetical protein